MNTKRAVAQILKYLSKAGITHIPKVTPPITTAPSMRRPGTAGKLELPTTKSGTSSSKPSATKSNPDGRGIQIPGMGTSRVSSAAMQSDLAVRPVVHDGLQEIVRHHTQDSAGRTEALCRIADLVGACTRCPELASTRKRTVFGVGRSDARIMFIGEAPGAEEDQQGEPFVGPAGQLLNRIIESSQLKREDLYICNILRCRPPGNRNPLPQEASNCREYLDAQIQIVKPEYIICWGTVAAQNLLNETSAVGKLRGKFLDYQGIRVMCTYHPSYLLRNPAAKKMVWEDMKFFMAELGVTLK